MTTGKKMYRGGKCIFMLHQLCSIFYVVAVVFNSLASKVKQNPQRQLPKVKQTIRQIPTTQIYAQTLFTATRKRFKSGCKFRVKRIHIFELALTWAFERNSFTLLFTFDDDTLSTQPEKRSTPLDPTSKQNQEENISKGVGSLEKFHNIRVWWPFIFNQKVSRNVLLLISSSHVTTQQQQSLYSV